jgi:hypothetical protein
VNDERTVPSVGGWTSAEDGSVAGRRGAGEASLATAALAVGKREAAEADEAPWAVAAIVRCGGLRFELSFFAPLVELPRRT